MGVSMTTVHALRQAGEEVTHLREEGLFKLQGDRILDKAKKATEGDSDIRSRLRRAYRCIRRRDFERGSISDAYQTPAAVTPRLFRVLEACRAALAAGAIVIVEDEGYRLRHLPIRQR
jgi:hypothetical protein